MTYGCDDHGPAIPAQDERAPTLGDSRITKIARIVEVGYVSPLVAAREIAALYAIPEEVRGRLVELVESWESGARISDVVVAAFQPDLDAFTSNTRDNTQAFDIRLIRAVVDEKSNSERLLKDAAALRLLLANTGDQ